MRMCRKYSEFQSNIDGTFDWLFSFNKFQDIFDALLSTRSNSMQSLCQLNAFDNNFIRKLLHSEKLTIARKHVWRIELFTDKNHQKKINPNSSWN